MSLMFARVQSQASTSANSRQVLAVVSVQGSCQFTDFFDEPEERLGRSRTVRCFVREAISF